MYAAALGDDAICEILLKGGAPVNVVAKKGYLAGQSALSIARLAGYEDIVKRLIAAGAGDPI
jgi:ankyrin repeat protein